MQKQMMPHYYIMIILYSMIYCLIFFLRYRVYKTVVEITRLLNCNMKSLRIKISIALCPKYICPNLKVFAKGPILGICIHKYISFCDLGKGVNIFGGEKKY